MGVQKFYGNSNIKIIVRTTHLTGLSDLGIELSQLFFFTKVNEEKD
jgi:hypothetical protein